MAINDCIEAARSVAGEDATDKQLEEILKLMDVRAKRAMREDPSIDMAEAAQRAASELQAEKKLETLIAKRNRAINIVARKRRANFYEEAKAQGLSEADSIRALNVGVEGPFQGAGRSVDAVQRALDSTVLTGPMLEELHQAGLLDTALLKNPDFELTVAREMARLNGDIKVQPTSDAHAKRMAEIFVKYGEAARMMQNEAGAFIRKMPGYITRQSHDQVKIYKAKEQWAADIKPLLDERTFDGVDDIDAWLEATWVNMASGNHEKAAGGSDWMGGFEGPGNLAKRASAERVLHFKSPEAWMEYNAKYGRESLWESVLDGLQYSARNTALMRTWGTNPEAAFKADIKQSVEAAKARGDADEVQKLQGWLTRAQFDEVAGAVAISGSPTLATRSAAVRGITNMATLGGVVLSAIPDIAVRAAVLRHNGKPLVESYKESISTVLSLFQTSKEKQRVARMMNVGTNGMLGGIMNRLHATDNLPGRIGKMNNTYFKVTLLTAWTDGWSRATGLILSQDMANHINDGMQFGDLTALHQTTLRRYGIGEREWDVYRQAALHETEDGNFLMPDNIKELGDDVILRYMGVDKASDRQIRQIREDLATSLSVYYTDQVREALTFGGAKERALMFAGTERGTPRGELMRFFMQFKQFPITFISRHLNREFRRAGKVDKMGLGHMLAGTTALGYLAMTAKDYAKGKEPREIEDAQQAFEVMAASMVQGGGLGIYGDFIFGSTDRMGRSFIESLAPPSLGIAQRYIDVLTAARHGQDPSAKAVKAVVGTLPYNNLFGARLAVDHMFLYGLQETLNPGYLRRYQRQVEREQNSEFWLEPTSAMGQ